MKEDLARVGLPGWSLIGVLEAGVNPYSGMFANGPRSLADNNARPANTSPFQNANFAGSRAGQWDNSQGYLGISNPVYGTLTFGRTNSLALDVTSAYDPVASTAFSTLGFSAAFSGFGSSAVGPPEHRLHLSPDLPEFSRRRSGAGRQLRNWQHNKRHVPGAARHSTSGRCLSTAS